ncbi:MAG TPA: LysR family transcriptional regulator [Actinocrinis sp.]
MLDVRRLRVLQQLASHGTVAATAEALHLTAPAVSQQLAVLEREAGLPVVERSGRTLRLTAAGELLLAHAEVVLGDLSAAESDLAALRGGRRGHVRIAAFASACRTLLPDVWRRLAADPADDGRTLTLNLVGQEPDAALDALRKRETDLAVVHSYTILPRDFPAGCDHATLMEDPVFAVLHPGHAARLGLAAHEPVDLARLAEEPWLTPDPETSCYEMIQRACGAAGFVPAIRARSSDFAVLAALVAAGAGVALVPRLGLSGPVPGPAADGGLPVSLHPLVHPVVRTIFTASRTGTARRPDIRRLIELLHDAASAFDA